MNVKALVVALASSMLAGSSLARFDLLRPPVDPSRQPLSTSHIHVSIVHRSLAQHVRTATSIVRARVAGLTAAVGARGFVESTVDLRILETIKGPAAETMKIVVAGGRTDTRHTVLEGGPCLATDDELVLLLWRPRPDDTPGILGLSEGVYRVTRDPDGASIICGPDAASGESAEAFVDRIHDIMASAPK